MEEMSGGVWTGVKRFILWDYKRGSWQYDVMVGLILAFIFLTPRDFFRDQPKPKSVTMLPGEHGTSVFWIEADLLNGRNEAERLEQAASIVRRQTSGKNRALVRLETIYDAENEVRGYMAFTRP
jgi:hypothetical protein